VSVCLSVVRVLVVCLVHNRSREAPATLWWRESFLVQRVLNVPLADSSRGDCDLTSFTAIQLDHKAVMLTATTIAYSPQVKQ